METENKFKKHEQLAGLCAIAIVCFLVLTPVLVNGIPSGHDLPHHYQCAMTFVDSIRSGDLYPSWSLNRNLGYGGMESRLYPPVSHYTLALFYLATNSWHLATYLTFFFFTFLGSLGIYWFSREYVRPAHAAFAACLFALLPYHLSQIYNTFFFAEYAGTAILPFTFLYMSRVCRRGSFADIAGLGVSFAALILTHLPLTVIGSLCLAVFGITLLRSGSIAVQIYRLACGVMIGLVGSSFFWVKVVQERDLLAKAANFSDPWLDYRLNFLVTPIQKFDKGIAQEVYQGSTHFYDLMFLAMLVVGLAFLIPSVISAKDQLRTWRPVIIVLLVAGFLATPFSRPVWDNLSLLQETQFPWRWLAVVSVMVPVIAACGLDRLLQWTATAKRPLALIVAGCVLAVITFSISQIVRPALYIPASEVESRMVSIGSEKGLTFWWTVWTRSEPFDIKEKVRSIGRPADIQRWDASEKLIYLPEGNPSDLRLGVFFHPNWKAYVNGSAVVTRPTEDGSMLIPIPREASSLSISFSETVAVTIAREASLFTWLALIGFSAIWLYRPLRRRRRFPIPQFAAQ